MNIEYRSACLEDLSEIMSMVKNCIITMERNNIFQWDELYPASEDFAEDIHNDSLYVGLHDGKIAVAFALNQQSDEEYNSGKWMYPDREYYVIHRLCVNCFFQNKGVGKQTLQFIEEKLKAQNIRAVRLDVFSGNPYAVSLYTHMGYCKVGHADWRKGRFYLMEKYLQ
ncbi:MAG: GNAT family N-acetyltransferase [Lachnospiraceae bacterium]|nr:GNAT family N-acetyltransferase [Lachnospiraceae bacterium]